MNSNFRLLILIVFSATGPLVAAPPAAPSNFVFAQSDSNSAATLTWVDNATDETLHQFEITIGGGAPFVQNALGSDRTQITYTGFSPGVEVVFRIRSAKPVEGGDPEELEVSSWVGPVSVTTLDFNVRSSAVTGTPGQDLSYTLATNREGASFQTTGTVPSWIAFDGNSRTFSATNPPSGNFRVNYLAIDGIHQRTGFLHFNVINESPQVIMQPDPVTLVVGESTEVNLASLVHDQDLTRAAKVETNFGDIVMGFYEGFPVTVNNFFAYLEADAWDGAFFHRAASLQSGENFVIQGGGFKPGDSAGEFSRVMQFDPIVNEFDPSRPNLCGTISMAKLGGDPNSATNQFFVSLNDNRAILDGQNGGFTVFGRATDLEAANLIASLPRGNFQVLIEGQLTSLNDWPLSEITPQSPQFSELVTMNDVVEIAPVSFAVEGNDGLVVSSQLQGDFSDRLLLTGIQPGEVLAMIKAEDLDRAEVDLMIPVTVLSSFATWADSFQVPAENIDSDQGGLDNLSEYAYGGDPTSPNDDQGIRPTATVGESSKGEFTFRHRTYASDLNYLVETSTDLDNWSVVWETSDGFDADNVSESNEQGDLTIVTIQNDELVTAEAELFFRLRVIQTTTQ